MTNYLPGSGLTPSQLRYVREAHQAMLTDRCAIYAASQLVASDVPCIVEASDPVLQMEYDYNAGATEDQRTKFLSRSTWTIILPVWAPIVVVGDGQTDLIRALGMQFRIVGYMMHQSNDLEMVLTLEFVSVLEERCRLLLPGTGADSGYWLFDDDTSIRLD